MAIVDTAPYAPTDGVIRVLETYRETGLGGGAIDVALVTRLGLGDEVARRVVLALRLLELLDEEQRPTTSMRAFKEATTAEYKSVLASHILDVYSPVFAVTGTTNLSEKSVTDIEDAFRTFRPDSLRKRMVTLFLGLCEYVGIVEAPPKAKPGPKGGVKRTRTSVTTSTRTTTPRTTTTPALEPLPTDLPPLPVQTHRVKLRSGGELSLTITANFFVMPPDDRTFVSSLIDAVQGYENQRALPVGGAGGSG